MYLIISLLLMPTLCSYLVLLISLLLVPTLCSYHVSLIKGRAQVPIYRMYVALEKRNSIQIDQ